MDNTIKKRLLKFISNTKLFLSIIVNKDIKNDERTKKLLLAQHSFNTDVLKDIGILKDNKDDTIKELREQIREMESSKDKMDLEEIGCYINSLTKKIENIFYENGISARIIISVSDYLDVKVRSINFIKEAPYEYEYETDTEKEKIISKNKKIIKKNKNRYDLPEKREDHRSSFNNELSYTENNVNILINLLNDFFKNEQYIDSSVKAKNIFGEFNIDSIEIKYNIINSNKNLHNYLKNTL